MPESFTTVEYDVLRFLQRGGKTTIPALAADLLFGLSETKEALGSLVSRGLVDVDGDFYCSSFPTAVPAKEKALTGRVARIASKPPSSSEQPMSPSAVDMVFKQARERALRERG
jgi:hypothetical protein